MSSMQSAPAHMAAATVTSFGDGLAAPDLIRGSPIWTFSASSRESPVWEANVITGTNPAYDTRLSSSNTAEAAAKLCDTCTDSAFLDWVCCSVRTTTIPVQRALSSFRHSTSAGSSVDRGLGRVSIQQRDDVVGAGQRVGADGSSGPYVVECRAYRFHRA